MRNFNKEFLFDGFEKKFVDFCFEILETEYSNSETIRGYKNHLNKLNKYAPDFRISELSEEFFIRYENDLLKRGNSYNTAKRNLKTFNKMINLAIRKGLLKENPLKYISLNLKWVFFLELILNHRKNLFHQCFIFIRALVALKNK